MLFIGKTNKQITEESVREELPSEHKKSDLNDIPPEILISAERASVIKMEVEKHKRIKK